jgi:HAD superfamily hydrolase (TIGR01509 family)
MFQACVFDFDGTIVDSEKHWGQLGDERFFPSIVPGWTKDDGARTQGLGRGETYDLLVKEYGLQMPFSLFNATLESCVTCIYDDRCSLVPGMEEFLHTLNAYGIPCAIASASPRRWIDTALHRLGQHNRFHAICSWDDVQKGKPDPEVFLLAADRLHVSPSRCMVLEDSAHGIAAAKAAGMHCIALATAMNTRQNLSLADRIITHPREIDMTMFRSNTPSSL